MDFKKLTEPFPEQDREWRIQQAGIKDGRPWALVVPYIQNRAIQQRLDEVCGPDCWQNEFRPGPDGGVICGISIRFYRDEELAEWVTKWDGAENTDIESIKGGLSNAMKRAAVQWGIGRELYELRGPFFAIFCQGGSHRNRIEDNWYNWNPPKVNNSKATDKPSEDFHDLQLKALAEVRKHPYWKPKAKKDALESVIAKAKTDADYQKILEHARDVILQSDVLSKELDAAFMKVKLPLITDKDVPF